MGVLLRLNNSYSEQTVYLSRSAQLGTRMANQSTSGEPASRAAVASHVASAADLAAMSRKTGLETLGYLLEMARLEAESTSRQGNGANGG
jgi:hypothetical protein